MARGRQATDDIGNKVKIAILSAARPGTATTGLFQIHYAAFGFTLP